MNRDGGGVGNAAQCGGPVPGAIMSEALDGVAADQSRRHRERLKREQEFFGKFAEAEQPLFWAELGPAAERRREYRTARVIAAAGLASRPKARVLEVGCGLCDYTPHFARGWSGTLVGIDAAHGLLREARQAGKTRSATGAGTVGVELSSADAAALPFGDGAFDAVLGNAVLHHLTLDLALPELSRVLEPGGIFAFAEPNLLNPQVFAMLSIPWLRRRAGASPDETAFVRWRLASVLEQHGLVDVRVEPFDFLYPLTPRPWIDLVERVGRRLEKTPLLREIAGSVLAVGRKPGR